MTYKLTEAKVMSARSTVNVLNFKMRIPSAIATPAFQADLHVCICTPRQVPVLIHMKPDPSMEKNNHMLFSTALALVEHSPQPAPRHCGICPGHG